MQNPDSSDTPAPESRADDLPFSGWPQEALPSQWKTQEPAAEADLPFSGWPQEALPQRWRAAEPESPAARVSPPATGSGPPPAPLAWNQPDATGGWAGAAPPSGGNAQGAPQPYNAPSQPYNPPPRPLGIWAGPRTPSTPPLLLIPVLAGGALVVFYLCMSLWSMMMMRAVTTAITAPMPTFVAPQFSMIDKSLLYYPTPDLRPFNK